MINATALAIFRLLPEGLLVLGLVWIALWQKDKGDNEDGSRYIWLLISAVANIIVTTHWWSYYPGLGLAMAFMASYEMILAGLRIAQAGGPSKGLSQIKGYFKRD